MNGSQEPKIGFCLVEGFCFLRKAILYLVVFGGNILHGQSTSFTSMGSLVRVQLSPPKRKPLKNNGFFFLSLHPGVHCPGVFFVDMNTSDNPYCPHFRVGSVAGKSGWLLCWKLIWSGLFTNVEHLQVLDPCS